MSQQDVYQFLKDKRKISPKWYSSNEVREGLISNGKTDGLYRVGCQLLSLSEIGHIKCKGIGLLEHKKVFRYK